MSHTASLEAVLRRDRLIVGASLLVVTALAWIHLLGMTMGTAAMTGTAWWDADALLVTFVMWSVMMVGMMLPSAAPMILLYGTLVRRRAESRGRPDPLPATGAFALGYILVWVVFSALITPVQAGLQQAAILTSMRVDGDGMLGGMLFIAAGAYQVTPVKRACLERCRSPIEFLASRWRAGTAGALRMGLEHGAFCVGCCWLLMGVLFAVGVMNLAWVAAISVFVLAEKAVPRAAWIAPVSGLAMLGAGLVMVSG